MFWFWILFFAYLLWVILSAIVFVIDDRIESTNSFEYIHMWFIPIMNIVLVGYIVLTWFPEDTKAKIVKFFQFKKNLYTLYSKIVGNRDEEYERKHL